MLGSLLKKDNNTFYTSTFLDISHIKDDEWMSKNSKFTVLCSTGANGSAPSPAEYLLMSLGVSSSNHIKTILDETLRPVNGIHAFIQSNWTDTNPRKLKDVAVKYLLDSQNATQEEVARVCEIVLDSLNPIAKALTSKISVKMTGIVTND